MATQSISHRHELHILLALPKRGAARIERQQVHRSRQRVWFDHETNTGGGYRDLYRLAHGEYPENGNGYDRTEFRPPLGRVGA
jgi:hypothetical protein